jgi:NAD(P)-dependent dehydrogenase (short-subunit alcohol dehydrogenase family)
MFGLRGKAAIVTGASRGLGREIAETLAAAGADLVLNASNAERLDQAAAAIREMSEGRVVCVAGDVADAATANRLTDAAVREFGRLDVLVNNAGVNVRGAIESLAPEDFDRVTGVNVKGPWLLCRAAAPIFRRQRCGRVVNVASALGLVARTERSLYCASKGALVQLTRELAVEWAEIGVTVNAVCPGPFETEMNRVLFEDPATRETFANYTAMKRWGARGEIGPAVLFLAGPGAGYITGAILPVDGGWVVKS